MVIKRGWLENPRTIQGAKNSWENPSINGELSSKLWLSEGAWTWSHFTAMFDCQIMAKHPIFAGLVQHLCWSNSQLMLVNVWKFGICRSFFLRNHGFSTSIFIDTRHTYMHICIYSLVPAIGTAQTWIRLVKLVNSVTKFSRGIDKFHHGHHHHHHHIITSSSALVWTWTRCLRTFPRNMWDQFWFLSSSSHPACA